MPVGPTKSRASSPNQLDGTCIKSEARPSDTQLKMVVKLLIQYSVPPADHTFSKQ